MTVAVVCGLIVAACSDKTNSNKTTATTTETTTTASGGIQPPPPLPDSTSAATTSSTSPAPRGVEFDPATLARTQRFGDLLTEEATLQQATALPGKPYVGRVRFSGTVDLTGQLVANNIAGVDTTKAAPCFVPDAKSAARLPHMQGDAKALTICFQNGVDAREMLGPLGPPSPASIRISGYTISYAREGERNTTALLSVAPSRQAP